MVGAEREKEQGGGRNEERGKGRAYVRAEGGQSVTGTGRGAQRERRPRGHLHLTKKCKKGEKKLGPRWREQGTCFTVGRYGRRKRRRSPI